MPAMQSHVTIIGSGLVGLTTALAFSQADHQVTVLSQAPLEVSASEDVRPISLSLSTQVLLHNLGVWDALRFQASPIQSVHVSQQGAFGAVLLEADQIDQEVLGYVVPYAYLLQVLSEAVMRLSIDVQQINDVLEIKEADAVTLLVQQGDHQRHIQTDWLVAADGLKSRCRDLLNISYQSTTHGDVAHSAIVTCQSAHAYCAFQRFSASGVWAMLPMWKSHQYRLVWTTDERGSADITPEALHAATQAVFSGYLPIIESLEYTGRYPLKIIIADQQATQRCVLLGDSAHRLYPISAQGFNLSVRDLAQLVQVMTEQQSLDSYVQARQQDQRQTRRFTQGLEQWFGLQLPGLGLLRGLMLGCVDTKPWVKRWMIQRLLGRQSKQPDLLCVD
jgi:2-octaprenyl-6-methoxyphenol hydroxylase